MSGPSTTDHDEIDFDHQDDALPSMTSFLEMEKQQPQQHVNNSKTGKPTSKNKTKSTLPKQKKQAEATPGGPKGSAKTKRGSKSEPKVRQRREPIFKPARGKPIARCYDECSPADRKLLDLRAAGLSWPQVRRAYADFTGEEISAPSTLPNRYSRLKSNFSVIREEDQTILMRCKLEVDDRFEKSRWEQVAEAMTLQGTELYEADVLHRQWKILLLKAENLKEFGIACEDLPAGAAAAAAATATTTTAAATAAATAEQGHDDGEGDAEFEHMNEE